MHRITAIKWQGFFGGVKPWHLFILSHVVLSANALLCLCLILALSKNLLLAPHSPSLVIVYTVEMWGPRGPYPTKCVSTGGRAAVDWAPTVVPWSAR